MKHLSIYIFALGLLVAGPDFTPAAAQTTLPDGALPTLITPHRQTVGYQERIVGLDVTANVDYEVTSDATWATVRKSVNGIYVHVPTNYIGEARTAQLTFKNAANNLSQTLLLTQEANGGAADLPADTSVRPSSSADNNHQSGSSTDGGVALTLDGNYGTQYHTSYSGTAFVVSETNPAILTYNFTNVSRIDYLRYVPRQDGNTNGNFLKVEVLVRKQGESDYTLYNTYTWSSTTAIRKIEFEGGLENPASIRFRVLEGVGGYASCAEMEFYTKNAAGNEYGIFADDLYTELKAGITEDSIANLTNPLVQSLAYQLSQGTYEKNYRVASYECYNSPQYLSDLWAAPGKYYDQIEGVTGINFQKGKHAVVVSGIPEGKEVQLKIVAWYVGLDGNNFDGGNPNTMTFGLENGLNVIDYTYDWPGLGYICYYTYGDAEAYAPIRVHFVNGEINGYLSPDKTNEEMHVLTANAKSQFMDVVGKKVHSIWTANGLNSYCKSTTGDLGYRQYMNVIDSLIAWEHNLLGFTKYNSVPKNHTMAYVNYTYYMFQGSFGVSFHHNQESRILDCRKLVYNDNDAIWGLSHEWGHQHQMQPYFCWAGMTEVTNNINSLDNVLRMGYTAAQSDKVGTLTQGTWKNALDKVLRGGVSGTVSSGRRRAYENATLLSFSPKMQALAQSMADSIIRPVSTDSTRAVSIHDVSVGETLIPLVTLHNYFTYYGQRPDFAPDWFEALRQNDNEQGSTVEKQSGVDKYELLASAQNNNVNGKWATYKSQYPTSCWVTDKYITDTNTGRWNNSVPYIFNFVRKASRLAGYNLYPFFEKWGFFRNVALYINDYGNKWYVMTPEMLSEFKADMEALVTSGELQPLSDEMVTTISTTAFKQFVRPEFPN